MDDIADEPGVENPAGQLAFWREEIERVFDYHAQTTLGERLSQLITDFPLSKDRFLLLIEGMEYDITGRTYATEKELDTYIYRVAVIVGLATLDILGINGEQAKRLALALGSAVQLTNIIRDVPADAKLHRVYLPEDLLKKYNLTSSTILAEAQPKQCAQVLAELYGLACSYYEEAETIMRTLPRLKMLPCRMMACVYATNLAKIKESGFLFTSPIKLTKTEKLEGVLHAFKKTFIG